jgi:bifunctional DNA-binding transcriptional regulator/antitoxin component of YhaV-PrlF toxin-antitoxin module
MLAKLTSKNQITLPKAVISKLPQTEYFDVQERDGEIILKPAHIGAADQVRDKLAALGISEQDVTDAVKWARRRK